MIEFRDHPAWLELRQLVARLSMISHAGAVSYEVKALRDSSESIGGRRPPGGDFDKPRWPGNNASAKQIGDYRDEYASWLTSYQRRTPDYFQREITRVVSLQRLLELVEEARQALEAWQRTPIPRGQEPAYGSPQWKRFVAESPLDGGELARRFHVTRQYINQIRKGYRDAA